MDLYWFFAIVVFLFGLALGSFLNVCIYRMPRGLSVVHPRSACPGCGSAIAAYDNIPVLSWVILGGKCRRCKRPITPRYAIVELLTGLLFLFCYVRAPLDPAFVVKCCIFSFITLGLIFTDWENRLLPDALTFPGLALGLVMSVLPAFSRDLQSLFVDGPLSTFWHADPGAAFAVGLQSLGNALLGAVIGGGFIWLAGEVYFRLRGIMGMGFGDVKLMAMIGAFLGVWGVLFTIFAASLVGSVLGLVQFPALWRKRMKAPSMLRRFPDEKVRRSEAYDSAMRGLRLPFGSFLGIAALFAIFFGDQLIRWYISQF